MPRIEEMFAFVVADTGPDDEGIPAFCGPDGVWRPMVGADMARVQSLREHAQAIADVTGKPIKVLRFSRRSQVEVIEPRLPKESVQ
jgi:hypothetical protein